MVPRDLVWVIVSQYVNGCRRRYSNLYALEEVLLYEVWNREWDIIAKKRELLAII
jgi:hypothetical protein